MAKKYRITDENGEQYEVEEVEEVKGVDEDPIPEADIPAEADALSPEEIAALKKLAAAADQLIALIGTQDACKDEGEEEIEEETIEEDSEDIGEDETEEQLVDTDYSVKDASKQEVERAINSLGYKVKSWNEYEGDVSALVDPRDVDADGYEYFNKQVKKLKQYAKDVYADGYEIVFNRAKFSAKDSMKDSKRSFGAIEKKTAKVDDEIIDDVSDAWAKRFGGAK